MTLSEAKKEFEIRYYLWANSDFEREIAAGFPSFQSFKTGPVWETYQFMKQLSRHEQLGLARALLQRFHPEAVKNLGETWSPEEEALRTRRDNFFRFRESYKSIKELESRGMLGEARGLFQIILPHVAKSFGEPYFTDEKSLLSCLDAAFSPIPATNEETLAARKQAGEKIKFATRVTIRKAMVAKFKDAFGSRFFGMEFFDEEEDSIFRLRVHGWIISTHFWFGRREGLLDYSHTVSTAAEFEQQGAEGPFVAPFVIQAMISLNAWLGLCSQTQWEYLSNEEVGPTCDVAIHHCHRFFGVAPKLLAGLDPTKLITS